MTAPIYCDCPNCDEHKPHPAAPAPDAATVDQIMALAINAENDADWIKVRAAVERVVLERDEQRETMKRWQSCGGCVGTFCKADALLERAERAEAERDGRRPMSSVEGMVQRSRVERAEAERDALQRDLTELMRSRCEQDDQLVAERDALKELLRDCATIIISACYHADLMPDSTAELLARIDAAMEQK